MAYELWTSADLYSVQTDDRLAGPTDFWRSNYYPNTYRSDKEEILFDKVTTIRRVAPFVLPTEQGKPIYRRAGEQVESFRPAYIKPKDAIRPTEMIRPLPNEIFRNRRLTLKERLDAETVNILKFQRDAIVRQWDLMAARSLHYGKLTIRYRRNGEPGKGPPEVTIDFGRDPGHTIILGPGADWSDPDHDILTDIQGWVDMMRLAPFGGSMNQIILGANVVPHFRRNKSIRALLNNQIRSTNQTTMNTGIIRFNDPQNPVTKIMDLDEGLSIWTYVDYMENDNGSIFPIMDPKSVFMSAPNVGGVQAFGAIFDLDADMQPLDIFPKQFREQDPSELFLMSQSAPLMIPVNPNRTATARVLQ